MSTNLFSIHQRRPGLRKLSLVLATLMLGSWLSVAQAQVTSGDVLVIDQSGGPTLMGLLFRVRAGLRTVISDFSNAAQGPLGRDPVGVVVHPIGFILVIDQSSGTGGRGTLVRIPRTGGTRILASDFGNAAQGPLGGRVTGVAVMPNNYVLVADRDPSGAQPRGVLFLVNPFTGTRIVLSNFGNVAQGPLGVDPTGVAVGTGNVAWVIDPNAGTGGLGALFRVNLSNGNRALVSDFGNLAQGPRGLNPFGVTLDAVGGLYVVDRDAGTNGRSALFYVDPVTGRRTLVSNFGNLGQGPLAQEVTGVVMNAVGNLLVIDLHDGATGFSGLLLSVDPATGIRTVVSDFGNLAQGSRGIDPIGVTLVSTCGDGNPDFTEQCDDGNTVNGDGCSATCQVEPGAVVCAKRIVPRAWIGTPGNDTFVGTSGADIMHGLGGNDTLFGSAGRDIICGGDGNDFLRGASSNDILEGGAGNDVLIGDDDKDILRGDSGDDQLRGGANSDTCDGGTHIAGDVAIDCETRINVP